MKVQWSAKKKISALGNAQFKSSDDLLKSETNCDDVFLERKIVYINNEKRPNNFWTKSNKFGHSEN